MSLMQEGIWPCTVLSANYGESDKGAPQVQINVRIDEGDSKGRCCTYEDTVTTKGALYIGRSCTAVGWKGRDLNTLKTDVAAWIEKTGGKSTVEIKHLTINSGKRAGQIWDKPNSIGRGARVLKAASAAVTDDANEALRAALAADAEANGGGSEPEGDIPFATADMACEPSAVARVLR